MIFIRSGIFHVIEAHDMISFRTELVKLTDDQLKKCNSGLIRNGKSLASYNLLEACCLVNNNDALKLLLKKKIWSHEQIKRAFKYASAAHNIELAKNLIDHGADLNDALLYACQIGNYDLVVYVLKEKKAGINVTNSAPLFTAVSGGHLQIIETLRANGFDLHANDDQALCIASRSKMTECAHYLITMGANVHTQKEYPLKVALINGDDKMVDLLIGYGANLAEVAKEEFVTTAEGYHPYKFTRKIREKLAQRNAYSTLNTKESTQTSSVTQSVKESIKRLHSRYMEALSLDSIKRTIKSINIWQEQLKINSLDRFVKKALDNILESNDIHKKTGISLKELFVLCWTAIHDDSLRKTSLSEALKLLKEGLCEIQLGDNFHDIDTVPHLDDSVICETGKFNKLIEKLIGVHPDVEIQFVTTEVAALKLRAITREEVRNYIMKRPLVKNSLFQESCKIEDIWPFIRDRVKQKMFEEFSVLFKSASSPEFNEFIDIGIYTDLNPQISPSRVVSP